MSPHKSQRVTSDNYQVTFILSQQVFEVSSISSHTGAQPSTPHGRLARWWHADADQNRSCSNQAPLNLAEVRILTENLYKFHVLWGNELICEFSDKGCNVKSFNKLLKKLRDSGSMTRRTGSGRRRCLRSDASLVFTRYSTNIQNEIWIEHCTFVCFKFPGACFCQKLAE